MTKPPPRDREPLDDAWLTATASRALGRSAGEPVRIERLERLEGGSDRNVVARAVPRCGVGTTAPVVIKATLGCWRATPGTG